MSVIENENLSELLSVIAQAAGKNQTLFDFLIREFNFYSRPTLTYGVGYDARYIEAIDDYLREGRLAVSCIAQCKWDCCAVCSSEDFYSDWKQYGFMWEFPAIAAIRLHARVLNDSHKCHWFDIDPHIMGELQRELMAIKFIARRWWKANGRRIRKTRRYAMSETLYRMKWIRHSLEKREDDEHRYGGCWNGKWRAVLLPLLVALEDIIMTGGLSHLLRILQIATESTQQVPESEASPARAKREAIIEYLDAHPKCEVAEVARACGCSQGYVYKVYQVWKSLKNGKEGEE